ncbi:DUF6099 family protein [Kitasatospora sp. NPDC054939]
MTTGNTVHDGRKRWTPMEALRLIRTARQDLAGAGTAPQVLAAARQAALLAEAVGARLAEQEEHGEQPAVIGRLLAAAGAHTAGCLAPPPRGASPPRRASLPGGASRAEGPDGMGGGSGPGEADGVDGAGSERWTGRSAAPPGSAGVCGKAGRLTALGELAPMLGELGRLLQDSAEKLVALACGADSEDVYWACIDGIDSGAECRELVADLHRAVRRAGGVEDADHFGESGPDDGGGGGYDDQGGDQGDDQSGEGLAAEGIDFGEAGVAEEFFDREGEDGCPVPSCPPSGAGPGGRRAAGLPAQAPERGAPSLVVRLGPP